MSKYYIELKKEIAETELSYGPQEHILLYVADEIEAEKVYKEQAAKMKDDFKAKMVEMNHAINPKDNKPCRVKFFDSKGILEKKWK